MSNVEKAAELQESYLAHVEAHGHESAMSAIAKFCDGEPTTWGDVRDDAMDRAVAALRAGKARPDSHRTPMRSPDEQAAGLTAMAPSVYARWNSKRKAKPHAT